MPSCPACCTSDQHAVPTGRQSPHLPTAPPSPATTPTTTNSCTSLTPTCSRRHPTLVRAPLAPHHSLLPVLGCCHPLPSPRRAVLRATAACATLQPHLATAPCVAPCTHAPVGTLRLLPCPTAAHRPTGLSACVRPLTRRGAGCHARRGLRLCTWHARMTWSTPSGWVVVMEAACPACAAARLLCRAAAYATLHAAGRPSPISKLPTPTSIQLNNKPPHAPAHPLICAQKLDGMEWAASVGRERPLRLQWAKVGRTCARHARAVHIST